MTTEADGPLGDVTPMSDNNGLAAEKYVPLTDVDALVAKHLLTALGRARIAAYLDDVPGSPATDTQASASEATERRLFVAAEDRADARIIVAAVLRSSGLPTNAAARPVPESLGVTDRHDLPPDLDVDAAFADLISNWKIDTVRAVRDAERALDREDEDWRARVGQDDDPIWLDDHHYEPPPPPPFPKLAAITSVALLILGGAIFLLVAGTEIGLDSHFALLLGVAGVLLSAGILVMRLRARDDGDDDGAVV